MKKFLLATLFLVNVSFAHDPDQMGTLKGDHLTLFWSDHAISGQVNGTLVYASPATDAFVKAVFRDDGQDVEAALKQNANKTLSGKFGETEVVFTKISGKTGTMEGTLNGEAFRVQISSKEVVGNHFVNPIYDITHSKGAYRFTMENGMACMGCSVKIVFVALGMLSATGAL